MKLLKTMPYILLVVLLSACIGDNYDNCPVPEIKNSILKFDYLNFSNSIERVHIGIFDANGQLVKSAQLEKSDLNEFEGVKLKLDKGQYTAVCWGNAFTDTRIKDYSNKSTGQIAHPNYQTGNPITTNDPLFFGKLQFTIDSDEITTNTIYFKPAHIKMDISIKGLSSIQSTIAADHPLIRINNLPPAYDFDRNTQGATTSYYPPVQINTTDAQATSSANTLRFTNNEPITVDVIENATSNIVIHTVDVRQFMLNNAITITDDNEVTIPLYIKFVNGTVDITINPWEEVIID